MKSFAEGSRVHIVAVGGSGMSAIARILMAMGCRVSGSDARDSVRLHSLREEGVDAYVGHDAQRMLASKPAVVVYSSAVQESNVELAAARAAGLAVLSRAEAVRDIMNGRDVIEVMGTHGKTTTAAMAAMAARRAGIDISYLVGSEIAQVGSNAQWAGPVTVVEGDESDASGFELSPSVLVITNIDRDHMDFWPEQSELISAFEHFAAKVGANQSGLGVVIACADDHSARAVAASALRTGCRVITYGTSEAADVRIVDVQADALGQSARVSGLVDVELLRLALPGIHNLRNAAAVIALAHARDWAMDSVVAALAEFRSTRRRFEVVGDVDGITVIDDYAHHPTAVAATIAGAQGIASARRSHGMPARVVAICQPYRWYRTAALAAEYASALSAADIVLLLDVYGPGEQPIAGAGASDIASRMTASPVYVGTKERAVEWVLQEAQAGDLILTLGGEDVRHAAVSAANALAGLTGGAV